jgi:nucleotide-binding universal stress UspA family protein
MSSILIPVDFSLPCHNAYRYGLHLAEKLKLDVVLAHYYPGSIDPEQPLVFSGDGSIHGSYQQRLRDFAASVAEGVDYPLVEPPKGVTVYYETEVVFSVSASIISRAAQSDIGMVVMAPRSSKKILGKWLGSTSTTVSESCNRPVYLIPDGVRFRPFRKVVVANNHLTAEAYPLWQIDALASMYKAYIHFVHVEWPNQYGPLKFTPWRLMEKLVDEEPAKYPFDVVTVEKEDITEGLLEYADKIDADLIAVVNNVRNRWRSMLHASLTQDLALRAKRPVLVLHTEDAPATEKLLKAETEKVN